MEETIYQISQLADRSLVYNNITILNYKIDVLMIGDNGIYAFLKKEIQNDKNYEKVIRQAIGYAGSYLFFFFWDDYEISFWNSSKNELFTMVDDIKDKILNLYLNTQRPYVRLIQNNMHDYNDMCRSIDDISEDEEFEYIKTLIPSTEVEDIRDKIEIIFTNNSGIWVDEEGTRYIQKRDTSGLFFSAKMQKYRMSETKADDIYKITLLGGWFGLHHYKEGDILKGILYSLSCGICGVGYIYDLILLIIGRRFYIDVIPVFDTNGTAHYKTQKTYYGKIENMKMAIMGLPIGLIIAFIMTNTAYRAVYQILVKLAIEVANTMA